MKKIQNPYFPELLIEFGEYDPPAYDNSKFRIDLINKNTGLAFIFDKKTFDEFKKYINSIQ